tara:strand:- start:1332 stop:2450 length:1119 start_codon:yes stop_codon:yes gene_type:complete
MKFEKSNSKPNLRLLKWENERILITGHTGFKGSWLSLLLSSYGMNISGISLNPIDDQNLFEASNLEKRISNSIISDIRKFSSLRKHISDIKPSIIFHLAAQPLVIKSYYSPLETWQTNLIGTLNLLEAVKEEDINCQIIVITTDKVYKNTNTKKSFKENDELGGDDPYSASKASLEIAVESWRRSFCGNKPHQTNKIKIATARAGNVIGGGDWSKDRIIPDAVKNLLKKEKIKIRNPMAIRPWQHVLEPLWGYIKLAKYLENKIDNQNDLPFCNSFNFGPFEENHKTVIELIDSLLKNWKGDFFIEENENNPKESQFLKLSISKSKNILLWEPKWGFDYSINKTINWYKKVYLDKLNPFDACIDDINEYFIR